jgi:hypothetical protein
VEQWRDTSSMVNFFIFISAALRSFLLMVLMATGTGTGARDGAGAGGGAGGGGCI